MISSIKHFIPTFLSVLRVIAGVSYLLLAGHLSSYSALLILAIGPITDIIDGWLARKNGWSIQFGGAIDLIADGIYLLCVFLSFYLRDFITSFWFIIILTGASPNIVAQFIVFHRGLTPQSPHRWWNRLAAFCAYACPFALHMEFYPIPCMITLIIFELLGNGFDLLLVLGLISSRPELYFQARKIKASAIKR